MSTSFRGALSFSSFVKNALPSVLSMVFLSLYTTIDGFFVSKMAGSDALAAINIVIPVTCLLFGIATMLATGGGAIISRRLGEGKKKEADSLFSFISFVLLFVTVAFTVLGLVFLRPLAAFLGSTERLDPHVLPYLATIIAGSVPMAAKLYLEYLVRSDGHPSVALAMSTVGLVGNVVLDALFVLVLDWGTFGAGLGTALSITLSALIGLVHFLKGKNLRFTRFNTEWKELAKASGNGSSEMMSELSTGITTLVFNLVILSYYGEDGIAAVALVMYVYYFFIAFYMGLCVSAAPQISYSLGSREGRRIRQILKYSFALLIGSSIVLTLVSFIFAEGIASLFLSAGNAFEIATVGLRFTSLVFLTCGFNVFMSAYFTALGDGLSSAIISTLRSLALVVVLILLLPPLIGPNGIWLTLPFADGLTLIVSLVFFKFKGKAWRALPDKDETAVDETVAG